MSLDNIANNVGLKLVFLSHSTLFLSDSTQISNTSQLAARALSLSHAQRKQQHLFGRAAACLICTLTVAR